MRVSHPQRLSVVILSALFWAGGSPWAAPAKPARFKMRLHSPAFAALGEIPMRHTCQGPDLSPPLAWDAEPPGTKSLALVVEDPDAPTRTWVHWVLFNLPPGMGELPEGLAASAVLANRSRQGRNDFGTLGWGGPCPPSGIHRYYFKLYALDVLLDLKGGVDEAGLLQALRGHVLAQDTLVGVYRKRVLP